MEKNELIEFFDNYMYISIFERTKTIYQLTNNLDLFLLKTLKEEFARHYINKAKKLAKIHIEGKNIEAEDNTPYNANILLGIYAKERGVSNVDILNETLEEIISENEYNLVESIFEGMSDFFYEIDELIYYKEKGHIIENDSSELIEFENESITSKIIALEKLGVIKELRNKSPFNTSINSLANALNLITGGKSSSIQPMLNAMLGKDNYDKNNPLNSKRTVNRILNKLNRIGFENE